MPTDHPTDDEAAVLLRSYDRTDAMLSQLEIYAAQNQENIQRRGKAILRKPKLAVAGRMSQLEANAVAYYNGRLPRVYLQGVRAGTQGDPYLYDASDVNTIGEIQARGLRDLREAHAHAARDTIRFLDKVHAQPSKGEMFKQKAEKIEGEKFFIDNPKKDAFFDLEGKSPLELKEFLQRNGIKAVRYSDGKKYRLGEYARLSVEANTRQAYNMGVINAARKTGKNLQVSDGPGCGWTSHSDPTQADGRIVTPDEAASNPTAHPNCQRQFLPTAQPVKDKHRVAKAVGVVALGTGLTAASVVGIQALRRQKSEEMLAKIIHFPVPQPLVAAVIHGTEIIVGNRVLDFPVSELADRLLTAVPGTAEARALRYLWHVYQAA